MKKHDEALIKATMKWFHGRLFDKKSELQLMMACGKYEEIVVKHIRKKVRKILRSDK